MSRSPCVTGGARSAERARRSLEADALFSGGSQGAPRLGGTAAAARRGLEREAQWRRHGGPSVIEFDPVWAMSGADDGSDVGSEHTSTSYVGSVIHVDLEGGVARGHPRHPTPAHPHGGSHAHLPQLVRAARAQTPAYLDLAPSPPPRRPATERRDMFDAPALAADVQEVSSLRTSPPRPFHLPHPVNSHPRPTSATYCIRSVTRRTSTCHHLARSPSCFALRNLI